MTSVPQASLKAVPLSYLSLLRVLGASLPRRRTSPDHPVRKRLPQPCEAALRKVCAE